MYAIKLQCRERSTLQVGSLSFMSSTAVFALKCHNVVVDHWAIRQWLLCVSLVDVEIEESASLIDAPVLSPEWQTYSPSNAEW
jgi:hypothetical protein